jgi:ribonuclease-3
MQELQRKLGYTFRDEALLVTALTHSSYANENRKEGALSNERLEFLGDAILGFTVAEYLYRDRPDMPEGQMSRLRAELVCEPTLCAAAEDLGLGQHLRLGRGEETGGGRGRPSILADAVEAVIAAVYLDGGIEAVRTVIHAAVLPILLRHAGSELDFKTALQELIQRKSGQMLSYRLVSETGPDHSKEFTVEVRLNGAVMGTGTGRTKKQAEQAAARMAYEGLTR